MTSQLSPDTDCSATTKLRKRAEEALTSYVGETTRVRGSIDFACRLVDEVLKETRRKR